MNSFSHHPDGWIIINLNSEKLIISLDDFLVLEPDYAGLPSGYIGREYKMNFENRVYTNSSEAFLNKASYKLNKYISKLPFYKEELAKIESINSENI